MKRLKWSVAVCAIALLPLTAQASSFVNLLAEIDGAQANAGAGTGSTGTGAAGIVFNTDTNTLSWAIDFSGLLGDLTVAHFHGLAQPGQNAGVLVNLNLSAVEPAANANSGTWLGSVDLDGQGLTAAQIAGLTDGLWYINIHSTRDGGGEIRGQVLPAQAVPLPASVLLLAPGLGVVGMVVRRRRAA